MTAVETSSLYRKLAEVVTEVGAVAKDGTNTFQNYKYTSAEAMLTAIRGPLSAKLIALMPSLTAISEREYTTSKGKASVITTAHVTFTMVDGESGERHECAWAGQGDDPADKGLGKAYTNAIKTFLREQFLIPQGDDPEADPRADERGADRAVSTRRSNSNGSSQPVAAEVQQTERVATAKQRGLIFAKAGEQKLQPSELANVVLISTGAEERDFDSQEQAQEWLRRALDRLPSNRVNTILEHIVAA